MNNTSILKSLALAGVLAIGSQQINAQEQVRLAGAKVVSYQRDTKLPNFIRFSDEQNITSENFVDWAIYAFNLPSTSTLKPYSVEKDELGFTHTRYKEYANGFPVEGSMVITHSKNGKIKTVNGDYYQTLNSSYSASLSEANALQYALKKVNAQKYMWENTAFEQQERENTNNPNFTFKPKGELVVIHKRGADYTASNIRLAYKFNIYAEVPLYRADVYVDANSGEVISEHNLICTVNAVGTAVTKFSGTVAMTSDNTGTNAYRLRETGRGNGINTYNMSNGTTYSQTDFTNTSSAWNVTGTNQAASDAHWGAEMTYDYYKNIHNRNSIDGSGYALNSYMHYSSNYVNAFWDGQKMTYGDGQVSQGFLIMTALDVCGHEISHGLTSFTSQLGGSGADECDALNEGNSDIFGTTIEWYARPTQHDWIMGSDITCNSSGVQDHVGIRDMSNPNAFQQPDTYLGTNWDTQGEPHNNNGPFIFWYYLLCQGGTGTNDLGNAYNVAGITMDEAKFIAFRGNTVYFTSSTTYNDARTYMLEAATDLYGACSQELAATTNAWYAVGVGAAATNGVPTAAFAANITASCSTPLAVQFANGSNGATSYTWNFGDGSTSTATAPAHTYTAAGIYPVKLVATGTCSANSKDSVLKTSYITVNGPPTVTTNTVACGPQAFTLHANAVGTVTWHDATGATVGTGATYTTPTLTSTTTYSATSSVITAGTTFVAGAPAANTTLGAGAYLNYTHYLIFNATSAFTLKSVDVYKDAANTCQPTIQLLDNTGAVISTLSTTLTTSGLNTVLLNWHVPVSTGYRLVANGVNINLYRNSAGATYPIAVSTVASITGTDVSSTNPAYYYYFYNWKVAADAPCYSTASVITTSITTCTTTGITANSAQSSGVFIYPNPAHNNISVNVGENTTSVSVVDVIGQTIIGEQKITNGQQTQTLDITNLADGIYFMKVNSTDNQTKVIRFIKN
ncbi:MAG: M4 family metallopeptidase [Bacteroidia bacterium]